MLCNGKADCPWCEENQPEERCCALPHEALAVRRMHQLDMALVDSYRARHVKMENRKTLWQNIAFAVIAILLVSWLILAGAVIRVNGLAEVARFEQDLAWDCLDKIKTCTCPETP